MKPSIEESDPSYPRRGGRLSPGFLLRAAAGGGLMGLANLVPGISGGTMLLAAGVFPAFIEAVADLTRLRFRRDSLVLLGTIVTSAAVFVGAFAGIVSGLVVAHTWVMYSLFIGLTLGGVPLIWKMAVDKTPAFWIAAAAGLLGMVAIALIQARGTSGGSEADAGFFLLFFAGTLGASAMVLPGISGGYLLLLLGVYVPILNGIDQAFAAARAFDIAGGIDPSLRILLPVGIGVVAGVAGISNLVKVVLERFPKQTLGLLLGLLLGAVAGLWPFQQGVAPAAGEILKGQTIVEQDGNLVYSETRKPVDPADYPREFFQPEAAQASGAAGLVVVGFAITAAVARAGQPRENGG